MSVYKTKTGYGVRIEMPNSTQDKRIKKRLSGFPSEKAAKEFLKSYNAMKTLGQVKTYQVNTVGDIMDCWHDEHVIEHCRHDTILFYEYQIKIIKEHFGMIPVEGLKIGLVKSFYRELSRSGKSQSTIKKVHKTLKSAFYHCYVNEYIPDKFMDRVKLENYSMEVIEEEVKHWDIDEIKKYLPLMKDSSVYFNIYMALHLGLRAEETAAIHVNDIDFKNKRITIRYAMKKFYITELRGTCIVKQMDENTILTLTKNKKANILPLNEDMILFLKARILHLKEMKLMYGDKYNKIYDGYLSVYDNGDIIANKQVTSRFTYAMDKLVAQFPDMQVITFHGLRHSCASWLISNGVNVVTVQEILNHSDLKITNIYTHSDLSQKMTALDSLKM